MTKERLLSLDAFRGITVAAMILVNNPGDWGAVYPPLLHSKWNGCTPTDLIFPFFLFIVGLSIHFAYQEKLSEGFSRKIFLKILKRSLIIFGLGLLLAWFPNFSLSDLSTIRIPGVLQRISIVFFFCSIIYFKTNWLGQIRFASIFLLAYFLLMTLVPVPGIGEANLEPETNLGAWLDRLLLSGHLWSKSKTWDPEGLLSTLPAIGTGIIGMLTGQMFSKIERPELRTTWLFFLGCVLTVVGSAWGLFFPINKALWTSSYVLYTAGIAMQFFAFCYWIIDVHEWKKWATPFIYYGVNAIFVYVASGALAKALIRIKVGQGEEETSLWGFIYQNAYASWLEPKNASLAFALTLVLFFLLILWWMYKKKIFIKV
ncbi:MAG: heparan-alpha-glucosaminide N-acetyltransferase domain-containing protein [Cyclobacteriaceae bacterium]